MMKAIGDALRAQGLTPRALAAWAGTDRVSALAGRLDAHAAREPVPASRRPLTNTKVAEGPRPRRFTPVA